MPGAAKKKITYSFLYKSSAFSKPSFLITKIIILGRREICGFLAK